MYTTSHRATYPPQTVNLIGVSIRTIQASNTDRTSVNCVQDLEKKVKKIQKCDISLFHPSASNDLFW
jgi:hypothetical protein